MTDDSGTSTGPRGRISAKWRPPLALVVACTLTLVLCLPVLAFAALQGRAGAGDAVGIAVILVLTGTALLGFVLWRILLRPIRELATRAEAAKHGRGLEPLAHYGTRETEALGRAMLDMARVLQGREAVLRSYADHATHELKSPLTVLRGAAELLDQPGLNDADRARLLERIDEAADRMSALLDAQRILARAQEPLAAGRARIKPLMGELRRDHPMLDLTLEGDAVLPLASDGLRLVLDHLLGNAAAHGAAAVTIRAQPERLEVGDDGPGISRGNRDRIFDPFFTTRRDAGGTGMGLAIVRRMLEAHGATIVLEDSAKGARFVVRF